ncbi:MAG: hypothetical protein RR968_04250 [Vagococcus sp.]
MKLKIATTYRFKQQLKSVGGYLVTFTIITLFFPVLALFRGLSYDNSPSDLLFPMFFFLFVVNIVTTKSDFNLFIQNGLSRRNIFLSYFLASLGISALSTLFLMLTQILVKLVFNNQINMTLFLSDIYSPNNKIIAFLIVFIFFVFASQIGNFIGVYYIRFSKKVLFITLGLAVISPSIIGMSLYYGGAYFRQTLLSIFKFMFGVQSTYLNPYMFILSLILLTTVFTLLIFQMNRKCEIK